MSIKKISKDQPDNFEFNKKNLEEANNIIKNYPDGKQQSAVMAFLYLAQKQNDNWIPLAAMKYIGKFLSIPYISVYEIDYHLYKVLSTNSTLNLSNYFKLSDWLYTSIDQT